MSLYTLRTGGPHYRITKFDSDLNHEATYDLERGPNGWTCTCPAGVRPTCRHRQMLPSFVAMEHVDDGTFLDYDSRKWLPPLADGVSEANVGSLAGSEFVDGLYLEPAPSERSECVKERAADEPVTNQPIRRRI